MLIKTTIAIATAFVLGTASLALAANENDTSGGSRTFGNGGYAPTGVNPAFHPRAASACALKYKTYDPATMTFVGADGLRHPCP
jgi:BA14K-like protein